MNSAARILNSQPIVGKWSLSIAKTSPIQFCINGLLIAVLISSLAIVYVTNQTRNNYQDMQYLQQQQSQLNVEYGQLLLEKGTVGAQARIQQLARTDLSMQTPTRKKVVIVK